MGRWKARLGAALVVLCSGSVHAFGGFFVGIALASTALPTLPKAMLGLFAFFATVFASAGVVLAGAVRAELERRWGGAPDASVRPGSARSLLAYGAGVSGGLLPLATCVFLRLDSAYAATSFFFAAPAGLLIARAILRTGSSPDGAAADRVGDAGGHGRPRGALPCVLEESPGSTGQGGG